MKKITFILLLSTLSFFTSKGQVGINKEFPETTLDVVGDVITDDKLFLENPGDFTTIRGSKLIVQSVDSELLQYDIENSKYGPINYAQFVFRELNTNGLQDYDTKIPIEDYIVTIQGYYFLGVGFVPNTSVLLHSTVADENVEGYQIYAYKDLVTETWHLKAMVNNSTFRGRLGGNIFVDVQIDMFLNLIIYRTGFISKEISNVTINMGASDTGIAPLPPGF